MYCSKCGRPLPDNKKINYCQICGAKVENKISYDNTNSLLRQNVNMEVYINNSQKPKPGAQNDTNGDSSYDNRAFVVDEKTNESNKKTTCQHLVAKEQKAQDEQPELDLSSLLDSSLPEAEEPVVEEQEVQEEQPGLDLSSLLDSSVPEAEDPVVEEQEAQEEQPELDLSSLLDSSVPETEEFIENIKEPSNCFDKSITTNPSEVTADEKTEELEQDKIKSEEVTNDTPQDVLQKELKQNYEPQIAFFDIDPMFGEAPAFDVEAIQRAYTESKKVKEISKNKKHKKIFGKQKRS